MHGENINLNRTKIDFKKKSILFDHTKNPNILHPNTGIISKFIHILGLNAWGVGELTLPETRKAGNVAQINKETAIGNAMMYLRRPEINR